jgi:hypothetical protein
LLAHHRVLGVRALVVVELAIAIPIEALEQLRLALRPHSAGGRQRCLRFRLFAAQPSGKE